MNRRYVQFWYSLEAKVVTLFAKATIGASGVATLVTDRSKGVASIARTAAGKYTITLQDRYVDLFDIHCTILDAAGVPAAPTMVVRTQDVVGNKTIAVEFLNYSGAATEVDSGDVLRFRIDLKASGV